MLSVAGDFWECAREMIVRQFTVLMAISACCLTFQPRGFCTSAAPATLPSDTPANFFVRTNAFDFVRREEMISMRDGVKLKTIILVPKGANDAPILLSRTPYNAAERVSRASSSHLAAV